MFLINLQLFQMMFQKIIGYEFMTYECIEPVEVCTTNQKTKLYKIPIFYYY